MARLAYWPIMKKIASRMNMQIKEGINMKKSLAILALMIMMLAAFVPTALASVSGEWTGDPTSPDEDSPNIVEIDDAPDDIFDVKSPKTGDASMIMAYMGMSGSALMAAGVLLKKRNTK